MQRATRALTWSALIVGCALRLFGLDVHSLWFDEGATWFVMHQGDIVEALKTDRHPPLSFYAFRAWADYVGDSASTLRLLPALCSCAALLFARRAYERLLTPRAALIAITLHALSSFAIWHAQEIRMYAMLELSAALLLFGYAAMRCGRLVSAIIAIIVGGIVGCGSHYFGYLGVGALLATLWLEMFLHGRSTSTSRAATDSDAKAARRKRSLVWLTAAVVVSGAAWLPLLLSMLPAQRGTSWGWTAQMSLVDLGLLPTRFLIRDGEALSGWLYWSNHICAGIASLGLVALALSIIRERELRASILGVLSLAILPVLGAFAVAILVAPSFMPRYLIASLPATLALIAAGLERLSFGSRGIHALLSTATLAPLVAIAVVHKTENRREDYRTAVNEALAASSLEGRDRPWIVVATGTSAGFSAGAAKFYARERARVLDAKDFNAGIDAGRASPPDEVFVIHRAAIYARGDLMRVTSRYDKVDAGPTRFRIKLLRCTKPKR